MSSQPSDTGLSQHALQITTVDRSYAIELSEATIFVGSGENDQVNIASPALLRLRRSDPNQPYRIEKLNNQGVAKLNDRLLEVRQEVALRSGDKVVIDDTITLRYDVIEAIVIPERPVRSPEPIQTAPVEDPLVIDATTTTIVPSQPMKIATTEEQRLPCKFCFNILNSADPDPEMADIVLIDGFHYHRVCWNRVASPNAEVVSVTLPPITKLPDVEMVPIDARYKSVINGMGDSPLGISESTIKLGAEPASFMIRNNSQETVEIARNLGTAWMYIDLEAEMIQRTNPPALTLSIPPGAVVRAWVTRSFIAPWIVRTEINLSRLQRVEIRVEQFSPALLIASIIGFIVFWLHISTANGFSMLFLAMRGGSAYIDAWDVIGRLILSAILWLALLIWFFVMLPGPLLWGALRIILKLQTRLAPIPLIGEVLRIAETLLWWLVESHELRQQNTPRTVIAVILPLLMIVGIPVTLGFALVWFLSSLILAQIATVLYMLVLFAAYVLTLNAYNIKIIAVTRSLLKRGLRDTPLAQYLGD